MADEEEPRRRMVRPPTGGLSAGRGQSVKLKTAKDRTPSSQAWLQRQLNDPYVARAQAEGWRSRAAFKLMEIDDRFHLIGRGARVVDLGCAPGGWVQVAQKRGAGVVVGVDLLPVPALPPATLIEGDFTEPGMGARLIEALGGPPDLVLSDMAPNTVGHTRTDHLRIIGLLESAAAFAAEVLRPGGAFVAKAFQGGAVGEILTPLKQAFTEVKHVKPKASRSDSSEVYLVATGLKPRN
jgi:23S rRNA (uridine2552-2'-O)-methyltransferase